MTTPKTSKNVKQTMSFDLLAGWLKKNMLGFYGGCRVDKHSPQVKEFYSGLLYYLEKDFGYTAPDRAAEKETTGE